MVQADLVENGTLRIGQLAAATNVTTAALRLYEAVGVMDAPVRSAAGYRLYTDRAVDDVRFVKAAQCAGLTLAQIGVLVRCRSAVSFSAEERNMIEVTIQAVRSRLCELAHARAALQEVFEGLSDDPADSAVSDGVPRPARQRLDHRRELHGRVGERR